MLSWWGNFGNLAAVTGTAEHFWTKDKNLREGFEEERWVWDPDIPVYFLILFPDKLSLQILPLPASEFLFEMSFLELLRVKIISEGLMLVLSQ